MLDVPKTEVDWQRWLVEKIRSSCGNPDSLSTIPVKTLTNESSIGSLCGTFDYDVFEDTSFWNHQREVSDKHNVLMDISGGMTPDIVLRSGKSGQNRIYIEVKEKAKLSYGIYDSQVVRYFLHLLATSKSTKMQPYSELRRAIILAAPDYWFDNAKLVEPWHDFCKRYAGLAEAFDVTLGEIRLNDKLLRT
ncbi:hypothetical protein [Acidiphilium sp.]|uniref:hypothetical protein n=1 Tax=Acidiphilium sp. TaxID=527 RepID=UPI003D039E9A